MATSSIRQPFKRYMALSIGVGVFFLFVVGVYQSTTPKHHKSVVLRVSDLKWGREVVERLDPVGPLYSKTYRWSMRDHRDLTVVGKCNAPSFEAFIMHDVDRPLQRSRMDVSYAQIWNHHLQELDFAELRGVQQFESGDIAFDGISHLKSGERVSVRGAFSPDSSLFLLWIRRLHHSNGY